MIIIHATLVFESEAAIEGFCAERIDGVNATRKEAGCVYYSFARDIVDPLILRVAESWADEETLEAHRAAPHMQRSGDALEKWRPASVEVTQYVGATEKASNV